MSESNDLVSKRALLDKFVFWNSMSFLCMIFMVTGGAFHILSVVGYGPAISMMYIGFIAWFIVERKRGKLERKLRNSL